MASKADPSLFVYASSRGRVYLPLYVDDILVTGDTPELLRYLITRLSWEFAMKDLGPLYYFLGIKAHHRSDGTFLSQAKYVDSPLRKFDLVKIKLVSTPLGSKTLLSTNDGEVLASPTLYRQMVIKRIYRYLAGTSTHGLLIEQCSPTSLTAYGDADWAACFDTRRSTSSFCVFLGTNHVLWSAKKQPTVACSSAKAEYRAVAQCVAETIWIHHLLRELGVPLYRLRLVQL
ncbi:uncharacterized mitochondrial protein AtMg00810-like [Syzygium oleosum]|uniref:uncharacterized mitochondrial protein AtMg00810-like n=1 Tax=Syzygium oleosum TaxID=219896 RepID=UPI0011D20EDE|nr:uncharacterized mitochondrial protein AtMg00810-like [Syzygium oleosum]